MGMMADGLKAALEVVRRDAEQYFSASAQSAGDAGLEVGPGSKYFVLFQAVFMAQLYCDMRLALLEQESPSLPE
jgi:hypothetical protein